MTLTRAGKALAMLSVGGGIILNYLATQSNSGIVDIAGDVRYITHNDINSTSAPYNKTYKTPGTLFLGSGLLRDSVLNDVYSFSNLVARGIKQYSGDNYPVSSSYDVSTGKTVLVYSHTNTSEDVITFTHYGLGAASQSSISSNTSGLPYYSSLTNQNWNSGSFLYSYYEFPEPIVIQPGETKTIQITIDINNL